jgi:hypothetical protein
VNCGSSLSSSGEIRHRSWSGVRTASTTTVKVVYWRRKIQSIIDRTIQSLDLVEQWCQAIRHQTRSSIERHRFSTDVKSSTSDACSIDHLLWNRSNYIIAVKRITGRVVDRVQSRNILSLLSAPVKEIGRLFGCWQDFDSSLFYSHFIYSDTCCRSKGEYCIRSVIDYFSCKYNFIL